MVSKTPQYRSPVPRLRNPLADARVWLTRLALAALLLWAARGLLDYLRLFTALTGRPLVERGRVASNEWESFLARAGRPPLHTRFDETRRQGLLDRQQSRAADAWSSLVQLDDKLPRNAKIYMQVPNLLLYFYANTIWYPRRVDVTTHVDAVIKDGDTLARSSQPLEEGRWDELRRLGYTLVMTPEGFLPLAEAGSPESQQLP